MTAETKPTKKSAPSIGSIRRILAMLTSFLDKIRHIPMMPQISKIIGSKKTKMICSNIIVPPIFDTQIILYLSATVNFKQPELR